MVQQGGESEIVPLIGEKAPGANNPFITGCLEVGPSGSLTEPSEFNTFDEALTYMKSRLERT